MEHLEFFFHITNTDDFEDIDLSKTSHGQEEIAEYGFVQPTSVIFLSKFFRTEDVQRHIEQNEQTKLFDNLSNHPVRT